MADKFKAFGAILQRKTGVSTYAAIPGLTEVTPPQESVETIDMTSHDSAGSYREIVASFKSGGTCSATFLYDPADTQHIALHTDYGATTVNTYRIITPADYQFQFDAYITGWEPGSLGIDGRMEMSITLTVTGAVTIAVVA